MAVTLAGWLVVVLTAGCAREVQGIGDGPPRPAAFVDRMYETMTGLEQGFAVRGVVRDTRGEIEVDMRHQPDRSAGTVTALGVRCELRRIGTRNFGRAKTAFWQLWGLTRDQAAPLDDRWVEFGDGDGPAAFVVVRGLIQGYSSLTDDDFSSPRYGVIDGTGVWQVTSGGAQLSIAATGDPVLRRLSNGSGELDFTIPAGQVLADVPAGPVPYPT